MTGVCEDDDNWLSDSPLTCCSLCSFEFEFIFENEFKLGAEFMFEVENEFDVGNKLEVEFAVELVDSSLERETKLIFFVSKIKL